jgi:hypothetical protein
VPRTEIFYRIHALLRGKTRFVAQRQKLQRCSATVYAEKPTKRTALAGALYRRNARGGIYMEKLDAEVKSLPRTTQEKQPTLRPLVRKIAALVCGFAGGWAMLYGTFAPLGLGLVLGVGESSFVACAAGAALGVMARMEGVRTIALLCALAAATVVRWVAPQKTILAYIAGCGTMLTITL